MAGMGPTAPTNNPKLGMKSDAQPVSRYSSTSTDNIHRPGVGVTKMGVSSKDVKNTKTGRNPKGTLYPMEIVNKARARMGGH